MDRFFDLKYFYQFKVSWHVFFPQDKRKHQVCWQFKFLSPYSKILHFDLKNIKAATH